MEKPNVLIIHTDSHSLWGISAYGEKLVDTPNIDFLAKEGAVFRQCYTPLAVCTPSRGCFITGRYPHANGAHTNNIPLNEDEVTLAQVLKGHGYYTGYAGLWHLDGTGKPGWVQPERSKGFDDCRFMANRGVNKYVIERAGQDPEYTDEVGDDTTYMTDWLAGKAIDFIQNAPSDQPFFYMVSIPDPHSPFNVRPPYDTLYNPEDMPVPETFWQDPLPDWARKARDEYFPLDMPEREQKLREMKAQYCGQVKCVDDHVGNILDTLRHQNKLDDTLIVFASDHGEYMGEHGLLYKNRIYQSVYQVPLIFRWPGKVKKGVQVERMISRVDFMPTLLGVMELEGSGREQGRNASAFITDEQPTIDWQDEAYVHPNRGSRNAGIFTPDYHLVYVGGDYQDHVLFDRKNDPLQTNNLFNNPEYQSVVSRLTNKIKDHHRTYATPKKYLPKEI